MSTYLNVDEVESALAGLASAYPGWAKLVTLPHPTFEGRTTHALVIGAAAGKASTAPRVLFTACQHAREWGGAEICIGFATDVLGAYNVGTGLAYGSTTFTAWDIASIVDRIGVVVFPCVNADGRAYDQANDALWRKNRNPASSGGQAARIGVDLNRNHDFLWDFKVAFSAGAQAAGTLASDDTLSSLFHGATPDSEPETRNIHSLFDTFPSIGHYIDIHSFGGDVIYSWGDDTDQSTDASMNFKNAAWNGQRGVTGGYAEYIPAKDADEVSDAARQVRDAINGVRGGDYQAAQSFFLWSTTYPTSGAVDDWAYARHFADPSRAKVVALTIEFGTDTGDLRKSFHPPWAEMAEQVRDIDAGLVRFCRLADPLRLRLKLPDLWHRVTLPELWQPMYRRFLAVTGIGRVLGITRVPALEGRAQR